MNKVKTCVPAVFAGLLLPVAANSLEAGAWLLRAGLSHVDPRENSGPVELNGSALSLAGGRSSVGLDGDTQLGFTVAYMLDARWGIELLAATPFRHRVSGGGELEGLDIADFRQLPPTLSAVYHLAPRGAVQPYVGIGLNYTAMFDEELTSEGDAALSDLGLTGGEIKLNNAFGLSAQLGADYQLTGRWAANASLRWIYLRSEAEIRFDGGERMTVDVDVDPWVYSIGLAYRF